MVQIIDDVIGDNEQHELVKVVEVKEEKRRFELKGKPLLARNVAKIMGFKALKGTAKQKIWAEKIRTEKLKSCSKSDLDLIQSFNLTEKASFWINQRELTTNEIVEKLKHCIVLINISNEKCRIVNKLPHSKELNEAELKVFQDYEDARKEAEDYMNSLVSSSKPSYKRRY